MAEIWKPVPSFEGILASNIGRILLPPSYAPLHHGGYRGYFPEPTFGVRTLKGRAYYFMNVYSRRFGNIRIHRAVCEAFYGPAPFDRAVVMHLNDDATDNRIENLKWGTQKENLNSEAFLAYCQSRTGENSPWRKHLRAESG